jgi:hypothetical protein
VIALAASVMTGPPAQAAETSASAVSVSQMDEALARNTTRDQEARGTIRSLLQRPEVRELAAGHGLDLRRAEAAVGTLEGAELQTLAAQAGQADAALVGGDRTVRIGLVAALLILIIVILLVN